MLQSIIVYCSLGIIFVLLCRYYSRFPHGKHNYLLWALVIYSVIFGLRYGVGADHLTYKEIYEYYLQFNKLLKDDFEIGYVLYMQVLANIGLHYSIFFGLFAFLQVFILFKGFRKEYKVIPYVAYTFMAACIWLQYANGMRQSLSFCILVYAIPFILEKKWLAYYSCICVAILMHISAVMLIFFYPVFVYREEWIKNIPLQLILVVISFILMTVNVIMSLIDYLDVYIAMTPYASYFDLSSERMVNKLSAETHLGIGFIVATAIVLIQILYSNKAKKYFKNSMFTLIYNLFFIGVLWKNIFITSQIFARINYYLFGFSYIVGGYTLFYLWKNSKKMFGLLAFLYFLIFVGYMYRVDDSFVKYYFIWQESEFRMPNNIL